MSAIVTLDTPATTVKSRMVEFDDVLLFLLCFFLYSLYYGDSEYSEHPNVDSSSNLSKYDAIPETHQQIFAVFKFRQICRWANGFKHNRNFQRNVQTVDIIAQTSRVTLYYTFSHITTSPLITLLKKCLVVTLTNRYMHVFVKHI